MPASNPVNLEHLDTDSALAALSGLLADVPLSENRLFSDPAMHAQCARYAAKAWATPDDNRIERVWLDLHANVTRNHRCVDMPELMENVCTYLRNRNRRKENAAKRAA